MKSYAHTGEVPALPQLLFAVRLGSVDSTGSWLRCTGPAVDADTDTDWGKRAGRGVRPARAAARAERQPRAGQVALLARGAAWVERLQ